YRAAPVGTMAAAIGPLGAIRLDGGGSVFRTERVSGGRAAVSGSAEARTTGGGALSDPPRLQNLALLLRLSYHGVRCAILREPGRPCNGVPTPRSESAARSKLSGDAASAHVEPRGGGAFLSGAAACPAVDGPAEPRCPRSLCSGSLALSD